jgi:two-component system sensor histidine kinase HydH
VKLVDADPDLLERVLVNLIANALEASPPDATVTVKTRQTGEGVEITVLDRGEGVAAEHREQIFNPFFTTKAAGVGLGLAISARIVGEHGGTIRVDSEPGRGAAFTVALPSGHS